MWPDNSSGDGWGLSVGPQPDGTYNSPVQMQQPADAGGGAPANYGAQVLSIFQQGVGAVQQAGTAFLDYKRYEAANGFVAQQGQAAGVGVMAPRGGGGFPPLLLVGGLLLAAVLLVRG